MTAPKATRQSTAVRRTSSSIGRVRVRVARWAGAGAAEARAAARAIGCPFAVERPTPPGARIACSAGERRHERLEVRAALLEAARVLIEARAGRRQQHHLTGLGGGSSGGHGALEVLARHDLRR